VAGNLNAGDAWPTIHKCRHEEELIEEYVRDHGNAYLSWDNYRRFHSPGRMISGMQREDFRG